MESLGCSGYLLKPIKQQQLFNALLTILGQSKSAAGDRPGRLVTRHTLSEQMRQSLHLLLVEDNAVNQKLAVTILQKAGYRVDTAETGQQAIDALGRERYSMVLMDVQMPEMDGFEATRRIRLLEASMRHTPIIAMTAHAMKGDRERCLAAGMDDYVAKPLQPAELFQAIERWSGAEGALRKGTGSLRRVTGMLSLPAAEPPAAPEPESAGIDDSLLAELGDLPLDAFDLGGAADDGSSPVLSEAEPPPTPVLPPAPAPPAGAAPLNYTEALPRFDYDRRFFLEIYQDFLQHMPGRLEEMQQALAAGDAPRLNRAAHSLKGMAGNFCAEPLTTLARRLEQAARDNELAEAPGLVAAIHAELPRLAAYRQAIEQMAG
jgi:CheY-like chemotaxis protein